MTMNHEGYPVFKGLQKPLEFMGIRGRFPDTGCCGNRRVVCRLYRLFHCVGQACRIHRHAGDGTGGSGHHLCQATGRTA